MSFGGIRAFGEEDGSDFFDRRLQAVLAEIRSQPESYICRVDETEYVNAMTARATLDNIDLLFDQADAEPFEADVPADRFPQGFWVDPGKKYKKPAFRIRVPITGDSSLLRLRPNPRQSHCPQVQLDNAALCFDVICFTDDADNVNQRIDEMKHCLVGNLGYLQQNVSAYNSTVESAVRECVQARRSQFKAHEALGSRLSVPIRKRPDASSAFSVVAPERRRKIVPLPQVPAGGPPNPVLDQKVYEEILRTIHDVGKQCERMPSLYRGKDEEGLRDLLLIPLEGNFIGTATGETFNRTGKTDILLRHDGANVFVAECKFWGGAKELSAAVDQLLGYLTWRDSKASIVMFVRNKEFTSVISKADTAIGAHPAFWRRYQQSADTWINYGLHLPSDRDREVRVALLLFHLPD